jgi:hypothetical protein
MTDETAASAATWRRDLIGKIREQLRSLHFRRDRDSLQR